MKMGNESKRPELKDGYGLPVAGLESGNFLSIHVPAVTCIAVSFVCVLVVIIASFKFNSHKSFWNWSKSERVVVYLSLCDGFFNLFHAMDHIHMVVEKDHVRPKALCEFYGLVQIIFMTSQKLLVNLVAICACALMFFGKDIKFGRYDWKALLYVFGAPSVVAAVMQGAEQFGPTGSFCAMDHVKGKVGLICIDTILMLAVFIANSVLYAVTWAKIRSDVNKIKAMLGQQSTTSKASQNAARNMSLFVVAFFVQWTPASIYGAWILFEEAIPQMLFYFITTITNIGGVLNLIVYIIIKRRQFEAARNNSRISRNNSKKTTVSVLGTSQDLQSINKQEETSACYTVPD